jgi:hypothetical protein
VTTVKFAGRWFYRFRITWEDHVNTAERLARDELAALWQVGALPTPEPVAL